MKKILSLALALVLCLGLLPTTALAADAKTINGSDPTTITQLDVLTAVGFDMSALNTLEAVILPEGVTTIGNFAFKGCTNLKSVQLPSTLTSIGNGAFRGCAGLETIVLPEGLTTIAEHAFQDCPGLKSVTFPSTLTSIGREAFSDCASLKTVVLPEGVTTIEPTTFYNCTALKSVQLPSTLSHIDADAFANCASLDGIKLPEGLETLNTNAFYACGLTAVTIPKSVKTWGQNTFGNCASLTRITLAPGLETIGNAAFAGCSNLTSVTIPDSVTSIGPSAFRATGLTGVTIPKSVTYLGDNCFGITDDWKWVTGFTVTGYAGTEAQTYADKCGFSFKDLTPPSSKPSSSSSKHTHRWDNGVVTLAPTDLTSGIRTYTCKSCGATRTEGISAGWADPVKGDTVIIGETTDSTTPETPAEPATAMPTNDKLEVNGTAANPTVYKIGGSNYFKIRDVAALLNGTEKQFSVGYNAALKSVTATTGEGYEKLKGDLKGAPTGGAKTAQPSNDSIYINGQKVKAKVYKIGGSNYFKLRDLGKALNFYVGWEAGRGMFIETDKPYSK